MDKACRGNYACPYAQFAEGRFTWYINNEHRIRLAIAHISNDGSTTVQRGFTFHGTTFPAGATINSEIDFTYSRLGWTWEFINIDKNTFKFGTVLDADWVGLFQMTGGRSVRRVFSPLVRGRIANDRQGRRLQIRPNRVIARRSPSG